MLSDNVIACGVASALGEWQNEHGTNVRIVSFEIPNAFVPHGKVEQIEQMLKIDTQSLLVRYMDLLNPKATDES